MGREVKRVALDFEWPLGERWKGYVNEHYVERSLCTACDGRGLNPATKRIEDHWYDLEGHGSRWDYARDANGRATGIVGETWRWCDNITQDEVDALVEKGRLREWRGKEEGWVTVPRTAEEVNALNANGGGGLSGHDSMNRWICVETRAKRLGVWGFCDECVEGDIWTSPEAHELAENWEGYDPPSGEGYQLWETTSEGSPKSPVIATPKELARWRTENGVSTFADMTASYEVWLTFARGPGWAPSMVGKMGSAPQSGVTFK